METIRTLEESQKAVMILLMSLNRVVFYLDEPEYRRLMDHVKRSTKFAARSVNEGAKFIVTKEIGGYFRPSKKNVVKA